MCIRDSHARIIPRPRGRRDCNQSSRAACRSIRAPWASGWRAGDAALSAQRRVPDGVRPRVTREVRSGCVAATLAECLVLWFCVSLLCDRVTARLASTHTALVSQSLVGLCFAFPSINFLSLFPGKLRGNRQILGSEPSLRLVWAQNQPNFRPNRQNAGNFAENPCIPGIYPATAWVFCRFPQFCLRFCPRPALRLRETREFPEWSTKHPLFSLEISGNAKCWGPSVFLFVCRKSLFSPRRKSPCLCPRRSRSNARNGRYSGVRPARSPSCDAQGSRLRYWFLCPGLAYDPCWIS